MRIVKKVAAAAVYIALGFALILGALTVMERYEPASRLSWSLGFRPMVVAGGSMEPAIHVGSLLIVGRVDPSSIRPGDVITFVEGGSVSLEAGEITTHRVMDVSTLGGRPAFRTQGDANTTDDGALVPASAVLGRAVLVVPYVGYVRDIVSSWVGLVALLVVCAALVGSEVRALVGEMRKRAADRAAKARV